jgi:hypothetical protein
VVRLGPFGVEVECLQARDRLVHPPHIGQRPGRDYLRLVIDAFVHPSRFDLVAVFDGLVGLAHSPVTVGDHRILLGRSRQAPECGQLPRRFAPALRAVVREPEELPRRDRPKGDVLCLLAQPDRLAVVLRRKRRQRVGEHLHQDLALTRPGRRLELADGVVGQVDGIVARLTRAVLKARAPRPPLRLSSVRLALVVVSHSGPSLRAQRRGEV